MINKLHLTILVLILFQFTVQGQTYSMEFGKINQEEIKSDQYSDYDAAEAVVLYDIGRSYFEVRDNSFEVHFERTTRIKVLSEAGIDWAEVGVGFYNKGNKSERVYDIKAYSYNEENGKIKKNTYKKVKYL